MMAQMSFLDLMDRYASPGTRTDPFTCESASKIGSASNSVNFSNCNDHAGLEQVDVGAARHLALDRLQAIDLALRLPI